MKILIVFENRHQGGLDTFLINLLNNWPDKTDFFYVCCNDNHPGIPRLKQSINIPVEYIFHHLIDCEIFSDLFNKKGNSFFLMKITRKFMSVFKPLYFLIYKNYYKKLFPKLNADRCLVVNGGYPGGFKCLSAIISWGIYNKDKPLAIHNFHNFAMPNLQCDIFGYYIDTLVERYSKESVSVSHEASLSLKIRKAFKSAMNISFVYNGVAIDSAGHTSPDEFSNIWKDLGICQSKKVCICLGTYEKRKGQPFILDVFKHVVSRFPEVVLIFAGHGSVLEKKSLRFYADQLGLNGNVYFMDFVSNVSFLFDMADLCLIGSQEYESFGLTSIEAMLYSVPVVSTNTGGLKEVILDGVGGFLFDKTDVTGFSNKVLELLNSDDYCVSQGKMGNERVNQIFSIDKMVCSYYSKLQ